MKKFGLWNILLVGLLLFHFINNFLWILVNNAPFPWDQAAHASFSLVIAEYIKSFQFSHILSVSNYYPIFVHTFTSIVLLVFGPYLKLTQIVGTLFFIGTIAIIYLYFDLIFKNKKLAFLTAFFFSFFPMVYNFSKWLMLDIPTVGFLFLTLYLWEKSALLSKRTYGLLTFISLGLLVMTKWSGILFLLIPFSLTLWNFIKQPKKLKKVVTVFLGIILFLIIILPWYATNIQSFIFQSKITFVGEQGADPNNLLSIANFARYFDEFINLQTTPYFAVPFFICFAVLLFKKWPRKFFILSMIVINYLLFSFISNKDGRYTMPILPFAAFLVAYALEILQTKYKKLGIILTVLLLTALFGYYSVLSLRPSSLEGIYKTIIVSPFLRFDLFNIDNSLVTKYDNSFWDVPTMLNDFGNESKGNPITVIIGIEHRHLNASTLNTYLDSEQYRGRLTNVSIITPDIYDLVAKYNQTSFPSNDAIKNYLKSVDYVLLSPNYIGPQYIRNYDALQKLRDFLINAPKNNCSKYVNSVAGKNTSCTVADKEILTTASDVSIDGKVIKHGAKTISGPTTVSCPYGCSFQFVSQSLDSYLPTITLIKSYTLPDKTLVNLYKLH